LNAYLFRLEDQQFAPTGAYKKLYCEGRHCASCGKCRDWYYTGDAARWTWIRGAATWKQADWDRYRSERGWELFKKRDGATCIRHDVYDDYVDYHVDHVGCLCENNRSG
jgi:hypothetical protein